MKSIGLLQGYFDSLVIWANEWSLELYLSKFKQMHFEKKKHEI